MALSRSEYQLKFRVVLLLVVGAVLATCLAWTTHQRLISNIDDVSKSGPIISHQEKWPRSVDLLPSNIFKASHFIGYHRRAVGDDGGPSWQDYVCKGAQLAHYLTLDDDAITRDLIAKGKLKQGASIASKWDNYAAFRDNNWVVEDWTATLAKAWDNYAPIRDGAMKSLGIPVTTRPQGENSFILHEQRDDKIVKGVHLAATESEYMAVMNPSRGFLVSVRGYSPDYKANEFEDQDPNSFYIPDLKQWSDVMYLEWENQCRLQRKDPKQLKHIFRVVIQNPDTTSVMVEAMQRTGWKGVDKAWKDVPKWADRRTFRLDSDEGKAILATPNVQGTVWFLLQHRKQLGRKAIASISVFQDDAGKGLGPSVYLELEDA